jgi:hypothetical protein
MRVPDLCELRPETRMAFQQLYDELYNDPDMGIYDYVKAHGQGWLDYFVEDIWEIFAEKHLSQDERARLSECPAKTAWIKQGF